MAKNPQYDHRAAELDRDLLSSSFGVETNWHVITGASCSGKTTLIDQLAAKGFKTRPEFARLYFERELARGRTIDEIRGDRVTLTRQLIDAWVRCESEFRATEVTFLDRGLPDGLAHYRYAGLDPNELLPDCLQYRYASVFLLNRLPYQRDGVRTGDDTYADYFESWTLRDYRALGYDVVRVPVLLPEERLTFVLERLSEQGLI